MKKKIRFLFFTLALQFFALSAIAEEIPLNDAILEDSNNDSATAQLQKNMEDQILVNQADPTEASLPLDNQPLLVTSLKAKTFVLKDSNDALADKISDETDQRNITVSNVTFKRDSGTKIFTYDQIKNVALNTRFSVSDIDINKDESHFTASLKPFSGDYTINVSGSYSTSVKVPLLTHNINKGSHISQEDIELKLFPKDKIRNTDIADISSIIGKTATKPLTKGKMISEDDIKNAVLISKNATVSAIYRTDTIEVKALAVALDEGGEGDIIRLKNFDSGKVFKAVVQADGNVLIGTSKDVSLTSNTAPNINTIN